MNRGMHTAASAVAIAVGVLAACVFSYRSGKVPYVIRTDTKGSGSSSSFLGVKHKGLQEQQKSQSTQHDAALQELRDQLQKNVTKKAVQQQLQGARLRKGVSWEQARQLLINKALLQHSSREGHAAARTRVIRAYYSSSSSKESSSSSGSSSRGSRGILVVGGSRTHLGNAYILLRMLREHLHCELPIEVVYYGHQELDSEAAALVVNFAAQQAAAGKPSITLIDGTAVHQTYIGHLPPHPDVPLTSWVAKIHALCWVVSFQHVLLLDSDNLPVQDPTVVFNTPDYKTHAFMIWPDFWHDLWMEAAVYKLLNLDVPWEQNPRGLAAESGQVLIDRAAHADVLEWLWMLNAHSDIVYKCVVGDKDTFKMAFELAGKADHYVQVAQPPQELLGDAGGLQHRFFHLGMGQASPDGLALMFLHRTARGKFFPWCAAKQLLHGRCQPGYLTMPVVQEQLEASVRDAGSMRFDADKIDTDWYRTKCAGTASSSEGEGHVQSGYGYGGSSSGGVNRAQHDEHREQQQHSHVWAASVSGRCLQNGMDDCTSSESEHVTQDELQQQQQQQLVGAIAPSWAMPLPNCSYTVGQLPIPALPVRAIPGLQEYLAVVDSLFADVQARLKVQLVDRIKVALGKL